MLDSMSLEICFIKMCFLGLKNICMGVKGKNKAQFLFSATVSFFLNKSTGVTDDTYSYRKEMRKCSEKNTYL